MDDIDELRRRLPERAVLTDPDLMEGYRRDMASLVPPGKPAAVVRPTTTEEVAAMMKWASETGTKVVPRGAGTGLSGGATALDGCVVVSLERMDKIRSVDPVNQTLVAEAGVVNARVTEAIAAHGLFYAPDPGSFEVSTIGGNLATNAGGMRCVKYGVTRQSVLGLEAVLADGRVLHTGGHTLKNVAGLDLTQLLIGSEGTLAVITAATLRLTPAPLETGTFVASFATLEEGIAGLDAIFGSGLTPSMLEVLDRNTVNAVEDHQRMDLDRDAALLVIGQADGRDAGRQVDEMVTACDRAGATLAFATTDPDEAALVLQARRIAGWAIMEQGPTVIEDVAVPRTRLGDMLRRIETISAETGISIATVGHAGDGNVHPILQLDDLAEGTRRRGLAAADRVCAAALDLGGSITGEHGVGELKRPMLQQQLDATSLAVQAAIKRSLDPQMILNPGRGF